MLSAKQRGRLAALSQKDSCLVSVGRAGVTDALASRLSELLSRHELVKLRLSGDDDEARRVQAEDLASRSGGEIVRIVGKVALFYRENPDPEARKVNPDE